MYIRYVIAFINATLHVRKMSEREETGTKDRRSDQMRQTLGKMPPQIKSNGTTAAEDKNKGEMRCLTRQSYKNK